MDSFFDNFQDFHGTCLGADAAGNALGGGGGRLCLDHQAEGTSFRIFAAADAKLLVDHINALGVLGDGAMLAGSCTFAALHTGHGFCRALAVHNLDAGLARIKFLIEGVGTGTDAFQTGHAGCAFFYGEFFHW